MKRITIYFHKDRNNVWHKSLAHPVKSEDVLEACQAFFYLPKGVSANTLLRKVKSTPPLSRTRYQAV